jgi:RNA polymerase sigma-70 factor (ECF subfamily)
MLTQDVWKDFHDRIFSFIKRRVDNPDDVRDLVQDIFIKIHVNLQTLADKDKLSSWVYQIVRNAIVDFYKKKKPVRGVVLEDVPATDSEPYMNEELAMSIVPFVEQLECDYRDAIRATDLDGMSQKQFAEVNGLTYSAAKSRIQRARVQLRRVFDQCCQNRR